MTAETYFSTNVDKTSSYELEISWGIEIKYLFLFKAYFHVFNVFDTSFVNAFKSHF